MRLGLTFIALVGTLVPVAASAQELTGTYITYTAVAPNGTLVNTSTGHSMQYRETSTGTASCDLFYPGTSLEEFALEGTAAGLGFLARNGAGAGGDVITTSGPTVVGREIRWSGRYTSGSIGLTIDQVVTYAATDRVVVVTVNITNSGTTSISNLYYLRDGDPDHGSCTIGTSYSTANDVMRQPPTSTSALVTAGTSGAVPTVYVGIGSNDSRARVSSGGFGDHDPSDTWTTPADPAGAVLDETIEIVFREATLAIGARATFRIFYAWGPDQTTVASRFDAAAGGIMPGCGVDGTACTSAGLSGRCRAGACCTGCWDGFSCQTGSSTTACGNAGGTCSSCDDFNTCTTDACGASRTCTNTGAVGVRCGEPFCEAGVMHAASMCDAAGSCRPGTTMACTSGTCSGATSCAEGCTSDASCGFGSYCEGSRCFPGRPLGSTCTRDAMCGEGSCVEGTCCFPGTAGCGGEPDAGVEPGEDAGMVEPGEDAGMVEPGEDAGGMPGVDAGRGGMGVGGRRGGRGGGCAVGDTGASPGSLAWLLALALGAVTLRRRVRR